MTNAEGEPEGVQAEAIHKVVEQWKLGDQVVAFVFNSQHHRQQLQGCVRVQKKMGKKVLFLACRHGLSHA